MQKCVLTSIQTELKDLSDFSYKSFHSKLIPPVSPDRILGVRIPILRKYAKSLKNSPERTLFLEQLPHQFYDENCLHAFFIEQITDFADCLSKLNQFLPYVDNWATCDLMNPKILSKHPTKLLEQIKIWIDSKKTYTIRFAILTLMRHFLEENFNLAILNLVEKIHSNEYYVNMMRAWFFATALAKQPKATTPIITSKTLDPWTHNKTIQKACESNRITINQKKFLKQYRIK